MIGCGSRLGACSCGRLEEGGGSTMGGLAGAMVVLSHSATVPPRLRTSALKSTNGPKTTGKTRLDVYREVLRRDGKGEAPRMGATHRRPQQQEWSAVHTLPCSMIDPMRFSRPDARTFCQRARQQRTVKAWGVDCQQSRLGCAEGGDV